MKNKKKNEKGITLIILTLYVIVFTIVLTMLLQLTDYIYPKIVNINAQSDASRQFNKFNVYFENDTKNYSRFTIDQSDSSVKKIKLYNKNNLANDRVLYRYFPETKCIYRNDVKIAENVTIFKVAAFPDAESSTHTVGVTVNNKRGIKVYININNSYKINIIYILNYWQ